MSDTEKKTYTIEEMRQAFAYGGEHGRQGYSAHAMADMAKRLYPSPKKLREVTVISGIRYRVVNGVLEYFSDVRGAWRESDSASSEDVCALADLIAHPYEES